MVKGLEWGTDDYVTKPFSHIELVTRGWAVLRRTAASSPLAAGRPYSGGGRHPLGPGDE